MVAMGLLWWLCKESIKNPPAMQETLVQFLGWEDPLEEGMATHSSILAWRIPMGRGAWWATVHGVAKSQKIKHSIEGNTIRSTCSQQV